MNRDVALLLIALALAITAAVFDVRQHRIPNWLTYPGIVLGVVLRGVLFGWKGLGGAGEGLLLAGGIMFLFYAVRAMGAGDVKLMAAIGSLVGPGQAIVVLLATAICGGVMAIVYAVYRGRMWATLRNRWLRAAVPCSGRLAGPSRIESGQSHGLTHAVRIGYSGGNAVRVAVDVVEVSYENWSVRYRSFDGVGGFGSGDVFFYTSALSSNMGAGRSSRL